ncbi:hypothetical protein BJG93_18175 [Paraburkholderia sprentiae WSM5005]|uniref:Uncharacterized protein n=1 Tax=Paraburkholderia sprentiae WSM5005 TaxID=754502 RepID=A0A1I9YM99_9BURK|nr:hypothetical protein [Paraburkholderia sprentiae]APA87432.2 hypothetical protein BJG93_18175 [Paraburkholderia sprentiae WSM5005]
MLSNEESLRLLRLVYHRQIPWTKKPKKLVTLRNLGLVEIQRLPPRVHARVPEPIDIAILTEPGQEEFARLEKMASLPDWQWTGLLAYQVKPETLL